MANRTRSLRSTGVGGTGVGGLAVRALALLGLALATGCVDARDRPDLTGLGSGGGSGSSASFNLVIELLAPEGDESFFIMGREMNIRVRGSEPAGRLHGLGYEIRRSGRLQTIQEGEVTFEPTGTTERTFTWIPPDTLPSPTILLIRGYGLDPTGARRFSQAVEVQVLFCPPEAAWC